MRCKNENAWRWRLVDYISRIKFSLEIFRQAVFLEVRCDNRNSDGDLDVCYLFWDDGQWHWGLDWLDSQWDDQNPAAILASLLFLSRAPLGRVLFCQLTASPAEHLADFVEELRKRDVFFIVEGLCFPKYEKQNF